VERRPTSDNAYYVPLRGRTPTISELVLAEIVDEVAVPVVKPAFNTGAAETS